MHDKAKLLIVLLISASVGFWGSCSSNSSRPSHDGSVTESGVIGSPPNDTTPSQSTPPSTTASSTPTTTTSNFACGDNVIDPKTEQCEGTNLGGLTCSTLIGPDYLGSLSCTPQCSYDTSSCYRAPSRPDASGPKSKSSTPDAGSKDSISESIPTEKSVELALNSRYSEHSLTGTASEEQLRSVLWAAGKAPITGSFRDIYVADGDGTFLYDPSRDQLDRISDNTANRGAFELSFERELHFDAGLSYMAAILLSTSMWAGSESSISNCPIVSTLFFGVQEVGGLNSELVAHSSVPKGEDGWLPDPKTTGHHTVEEVLANLKYTSNFIQTNLTKQQISQILWAGYGCTPHTTVTGSTGLTVPSAVARYYLTETIYLVNENGVYRYHNRNPSTDLRTRDHRVERIKSGDARSSLRSALGGLSQAPAYVILCLKSSAVGQEFAELEAGFVASNILMQASAIDLGCHFKTKLTSNEQVAIQNTTDIPSSHIPLVVVSIGNTPH